MGKFTVNPSRMDPYKIAKFHVVVDGNAIPGITGVSGLSRHTETILHREDSFPSHMITSPGLTTFEPITLQRGITHDTTFENWADMSFSQQGDQAMSLKNFRKNMLIKLFNQQGTPVLTYMVYRCWVAEYQALPELDSMCDAIAVETIVLQHDGWERDRAVGEPSET